MKVYDYKHLSDNELSHVQRVLTIAIQKTVANESKEQKKELRTMKKKLESVNKEIKYRLLEEKAVSSLIRWAKSEELCFDEVQKKVDDWLIFFINHNAPIKKEDLIFHREMAIDILIIRCIRKCSSNELSVLDSIKRKLAEKIPS